MVDAIVITLLCLGFYLGGYDSAKEKYGKKH